MLAHDGSTTVAVDICVYAGDEGGDCRKQSGVTLSGAVIF